MTIRKQVTAIITATLVSAGAANAQADNTTGTSDAPAALAQETTDKPCLFGPCYIAGVRIGNPFNPSTWWDGAEEAGHKQADMQINPLDPEFLMKIPNPQFHSTIHLALTNPETWGQFMKPDTVTTLMSGAIEGDWLDRATYEVLTDPQTYAYWVQPGAFMHLVEVDHYAQLVRPGAYLNLFNDVRAAWFDDTAG